MPKSNFNTPNSKNPVSPSDQKQAANVLKTESDAINVTDKNWRNMWSVPEELRTLSVLKLGLTHMQQQTKLFDDLSFDRYDLTVTMFRDIMRHEDLIKYTDIGQFLLDLIPYETKSEMHMSGYSISTFDIDDYLKYAENSITDRESADFSHDFEQEEDQRKSVSDGSTQAEKRSDEYSDDDISPAGYWCKSVSDGSTQAEKRSDEYSDDDISPAGYWCKSVSDGSTQAEKQH